MRLVFGTVAVAAISLCSCGSEGVTGTDIRILTMQSLGQNVILPQFQEFESRAAVLADAALTFCAAPDDAGLQVVRQAWGEARTAWKHTDVLSFGPTVEEPVRTTPKVDFWPSRPESIEELLASDAVLTAESLASMGTTVRGLPAIEVVIFGTEPGQPVLAEVFEADGGERRCEWLVAAAADVEARATELYAAWAPESGNYLAQLTNPGQPDGAFTSVTMAFGELVNRMAFLTENARGDRMNRPMGRDTAGTPQPEIVESRFSQRSLQDIQDSLQGVANLFTGDFNGVNGDGFAEYCRERGRDLEPRFLELFAAANAALAAIPVPLDEAVVDHRTEVEAAMAALRELQVFLQTDLVAVTGVSVSFNDSDGD